MVQLGTAVINKAKKKQSTRIGRLGRPAAVLEQVLEEVGRRRRLDVAVHAVRL